jgi:AcrR family transcriptional regulator
MPRASQATGRRERNKQQKLERIIAAAGELFAERGVDDVTTQEIAEKADIGTGTLFLYAKNKGELLLLVQNSHYAQALEQGRLDAASVADAVMAVVRPIVECNRAQVENGRSYLREMAFGDPSEPHHAQALAIVMQTEAALSALVAERSQLNDADAATFARLVSAAMFLTLAVSVNTTLTIDEVVSAVDEQVRFLTRQVGSPSPLRRRRGTVSAE